MIDALVFNGSNSLDFQDIRANVLRIPEVGQRIQEAQALWDSKGKEDFDLFNFLASDNSVYLSCIQMKNLAASVVQLGLYDRYLKNFRRPQFLIGNSRGVSAVKVVAGKIDFEQLVLGEQSTENENEKLVLATAETPQLSGISLTAYGVYRWSEAEDKYISVDIESMDINKVVTMMVDEYNVRKFINIGPGNSLLVNSHEDLVLSDVQILESIDLDPMLNWFWPGMKRQEMVSPASGL